MRSRISIILLSSFLVTLGAGSLHADDCTGITGNLVPNCGVESLGQAQAWDPDLTFAMGSGETGNGGYITSINDLGGEFAQVRSDCFLVSETTAYGVGFWVRVVGGSGVECRPNLVTYTDNACTTGQDIKFPGDSVAVGSTYVRVNDDVNTQAGDNQGARVYVDCNDQFSGGGTFDLYVDNAFAGVGLVPVELESFAVE